MADTINYYTMLLNIKIVKDKMCKITARKYIETLRCPIPPYVMLLMSNIILSFLFGVGMVSNVYKLTLY